MKKVGHFQNDEKIIKLEMQHSGNQNTKKGKKKHSRKKGPDLMDEKNRELRKRLKCKYKFKRKFSLVG